MGSESDREGPSDGVGGEGLREGGGVGEGEVPGEWAGLGGGLEEAGEVTGEEGAGAHRLAAREARVGVGSDVLVRCGRKEKEMGYSRARVAAVVAVRTVVDGSRGLR